MDLRILLLALFLLPATQAALLEDPAGDSGGHPCSPATDLLRFDVIVAQDGYTFQYVFASVFDAQDALMQDLAGTCFWSYTDFTFYGVQEVADAVYFDHNANPAFETGWRAYLQDAGTALDIHVEGEAITIDVPFSALAEPGPAPQIGAFRVQVSTALDDLALTYETDWAPDHAEPCDCWVIPAGPATEADSPMDAAVATQESADAPVAAVPFGPWLAVVALVVVALLRRS